MGQGGPQPKPQCQHDVTAVSACGPASPQFQASVPPVTSCVWHQDSVFGIQVARICVLSMKCFFTLRKTFGEGGAEDVSIHTLTLIFALLFTHTHKLTLCLVLCLSSQAPRRPLVWPPEWDCEGGLLESSRTKVSSKDT